MSYLHVGEAGAVGWEILVGSARSAEADDTDGSRVPWPREGGLTWCREDEMWPPRVFAIATV